MKIIGLIGGSGCGKSTVAHLLCEHGLSHIDCDLLARRVVEPGNPCLEELASCFGDDKIRSDGTLDRQKLASDAFSSAENTDKLNKITHKYILDELEKEIAKNADRAGVIVDAAALAESGFLDKCDTVIAVLAPRRRRIRRIMKRDNMTYAQAQQRIDAQKPDSFYREHSDFCIINDLGLGRLQKRTDAVAKKILDANDNYEKA